MLINSNDKKKVVVLLVLFVVLLTLAGCSLLGYGASELGSALKGRTMQIQTYDEDSNPIDKVAGKSIDIRSDGKFDLKDSENNTVEKSSVISIVIGKNIMLHVGSSLLAIEDGLVNYVDEFEKVVDVKNSDKSMPFLTRLTSNFTNLTTGTGKLLLIRSQTGKPLAVFKGESVSYFSTDVDKSTAFYIDGKVLFVYRCDYSVYDVELL